MSMKSFALMAGRPFQRPYVDEPVPCLAETIIAQKAPSRIVKN